MNQPPISDLSHTCLFGISGPVLDPSTTATTSSSWALPLSNRWVLQVQQYGNDEGRRRQQEEEQAAARNGNSFLLAAQGTSPPPQSPASSRSATLLFGAQQEWPVTAPIAFNSLDHFVACWSGTVHAIVDDVERQWCDGYLQPILTEKGTTIYRIPKSATTTIAGEGGVAGGGGRWTSRLLRDQQQNDYQGGGSCSSTPDDRSSAGRGGASTATSASTCSTQSHATTAVETLRRALRSNFVNRNSSAATTPAAATSTTSTTTLLPPVARLSIDRVGQQMSASGCLFSTGASSSPNSTTPAKPNPFKPDASGLRAVAKLSTVTVSIPLARLMTAFDAEANELKKQLQKQQQQLQQSRGGGGGDSGLMYLPQPSVSEDPQQQQQQQHQQQRLSPLPPETSRTTSLAESDFGEDCGSGSGGAGASRTSGMPYNQRQRSWTEDDTAAPTTAAQQATTTTPTYITVSQPQVRFRSLHPECGALTAEERREECDQLLQLLQSILNEVGLTVVAATPTFTPDLFNVPPESSSSSSLTSPAVYDQSSISPIGFEAFVRVQPPQSASSARGANTPGTPSQPLLLSGGASRTTSSRASPAPFLLLEDVVHDMALSTSLELRFVFRSSMNAGKGAIEAVALPLLPPLVQRILQEDRYSPFDVSAALTAFSSPSSTPPSASLSSRLPMSLQWHRPAVLVIGVLHPSDGSSLNEGVRIPVPRNGTGPAPSATHPNHPQLPDFSGQTGSSSVRPTNQDSGSHHATDDGVQSTPRGVFSNSSVVSSSRRGTAAWGSCGGADPSIVTSVPVNYAAAVTARSASQSPSVLLAECDEALVECPPPTTTTAMTEAAPAARRTMKRPNNSNKPPQLDTSSTSGESAACFATPAQQKMARPSAEDTPKQQQQQQGIATGVTATKGAEVSTSPTSSVPIPPPSVHRHDGITSLPVSLSNEFSNGEVLLGATTSSVVLSGSTPSSTTSSSRPPPSEPAPYQAEGRSKNGKPAAPMMMTLPALSATVTPTTPMPPSPMVAVVSMEDELIQRLRMLQTLSADANECFVYVESLLQVGDEQTTTTAASPSKVTTITTNPSTAVQQAQSKDDAHRDVLTTELRRFIAQGCFSNLDDSMDDDRAERRLNELYETLSPQLVQELVGVLRFTIRTLKKTSFPSEDVSIFAAKQFSVDSKLFQHCRDVLVSRSTSSSSSSTQVSEQPASRGAPPKIFVEGGPAGAAEAVGAAAEPPPTLSSCSTSVLSSFSNAASPSHLNQQATRQSLRNEDEANPVVQAFLSFCNDMKRKLVQSLDQYGMFVSLIESDLWEAMSSTTSSSAPSAAPRSKKEMSLTQQLFSGMFFEQERNEWQALLAKEQAERALALSSSACPAQAEKKADVLASQQPPVVSSAAPSSTKSAKSKVLRVDTARAPAAAAAAPEVLPSSKQLLPADTTRVPLSTNQKAVTTSATAQPSPAPTAAPPVAPVVALTPRGGGGATAAVPPPQPQVLSAKPPLAPSPNHHAKSAKQQQLPPPSSLPAMPTLQPPPSASAASPSSSESAADASTSTTVPVRQNNNNNNNHSKKGSKSQPHLTTTLAVDSTPAAAVNASKQGTTTALSSSSSSPLVAPSVSSPSSATPAGAAATAASSLSHYTPPPSPSRHPQHHTNNNNKTATKLTTTTSLSPVQLPSNEVAPAPPPPPLEMPLPAAASSSGMSLPPQQGSSTGGSKQSQKTTGKQKQPHPPPQSGKTESTGPEDSQQQQNNSTVKKGGASRASGAQLKQKKSGAAHLSPKAQAMIAVLVLVIAAVGGVVFA